MTGFSPFGTPPGSSPSSIRLVREEAPERQEVYELEPDEPSPSVVTPLNAPKLVPTDDTPSMTTSLGENSPWIGGTGLGSTALGKSGRVIERLMAENDRLRREMKAEIAKREELQRAAQTQKPKIDSLQAENSRLSNIKAMDDSIIKRRDRKIEDLKAELEVERKKREMFERRAQDAERGLDERDEHNKQELQSAIEQAKHASTHAAILEISHKQLAAEYRQRTATINKSIRDLLEGRDADKKKLAKLDVVTNQMRQELERIRKLYSELLVVWEKFRDTKSQEVDEIMEGVEELKQSERTNNERNNSLRDDMEKIMGQMKWVMGVQKAVSEDGLTSPPPSPPK